MSFHDVQFPTDIAEGSASGTGFKTSVIALDSGHEQRNSRWAGPKRQYDVSYGIKTHNQLRALLAFFIARDGALNSFRFKDYLDFKSCTGMDDIVSAFDQVIGTGDGSETEFQLKKIYVNGAYERTRNITTPVSGTVKIGIDGVESLSGWSVNTTTGIITFTSPPALNEEITAGFEFDVPVRFTQSIDDLLNVSMEQVDMGTIPQIQLVEVLDDTAINAEMFYGGGAYLILTENTLIGIQDGRALILNAGAGLILKLPDTTNLPTGGPYFYLMNNGGNVITVNAFDDTPVGSIGISENWIVLLVEISGVKTWIILSNILPT